MRTKIFLLILYSTQFSFAQSSNNYIKGNNSFDNGNFSEAIEFYTQYIESTLKSTGEWVPNTLWEAYLNRGMAFHQIENYKMSMKDYNEVINHSPNNAQAFALRGELKSSLKDFYGALKDYNEAVRLQPKGLYILNRGIVKGKMKNYIGAIEDFDFVIEIDPKDEIAFYNRGYAYILIGDKIKGCADLSKAGELGYFKAYELINDYCNK